MRVGKVIRKLFKEEYQIAGKIFIYVFFYLLIIHWTSLIWLTLSKSFLPDDEGSITYFDSWVPTNF